jgi:hypothetical protein
MINSMCISSSGRQINKSKSLPKWLERIQTSQMMEKEKIVIEIITIQTAGAIVLATAILIVEDAEDVEEAAVAAVGEETIVSNYKMSNVSIVARKITIPLNVPSRERLTMKTLINYSHSRNPPCAPARTHGRIQAPREPPN